MIYDEKTLSYLNGNDISNAYKISIKWKQLVARNELLIKLCEGKNVLHVGCADHIELIKQKKTQGNYLHDLIQSSAKKVTGCDVNEEALENMKLFGIKELYTPDKLPTQKYDVVIIPDVIEHISNVEQFLLSIQKHEASDFIFTTPNAYRLKNKRYWQHELINTDHRCWFSPYTLSKTLIDANFKIRDIYYTDAYSLLNPVGNIIKFLFPLTRDGLLIVATKK